MVCAFWSGFLQAQACAVVLAVSSCSSLPSCIIFFILSLGGNKFGRLKKGSKTLHAGKFHENEVGENRSTFSH